MWVSPINQLYSLFKNQNWDSNLKLWEKYTLQKLIWIDENGWNGLFFRSQFASMKMDEMDRSGMKSSSIVWFYKKLMNEMECDEIHLSMVWNKMYWNGVMLYCLVLKKINEMKWSGMEVDTYNITILAHFSFSHPLPFVMYQWNEIN